MLPKVYLFIYLRNEPCEGNFLILDASLLFLFFFFSILFILEKGEFLSIGF